jgi:hypothetical protein
MLAMVELGVYGDVAGDGIRVVWDIGDWGVRTRGKRLLELLGLVGVLKNEGVDVL